MSEIPRIGSAVPVINGVLKIVWADGYEAVVDLRPVLATGDIFAFLHEAGAFGQAQVGDHGSTVYWTDPAGRVIDFGTLSLRQRAETQAELLRLAS